MLIRRIAVLVVFLSTVFAQTTLAQCDPPPPPTISASYTTDAVTVTFDVGGPPRGFIWLEKDGAKVREAQMVGNGDSPYVWVLGTCEFPNGTALTAKISNCEGAAVAEAPTMISDDRNPQLLDLRYVVTSPNAVDVEVDYSFGTYPARALYIEYPTHKGYVTAYQSGTLKFGADADNRTQFVVAEVCGAFGERDVQAFRAHPQECASLDLAPSDAPSGPNPNSCGVDSCEGDPVRMASGNMRYSEVDPIPFEPLRFVRTFDSRLLGGETYSYFGHSWKSLFDARLSLWASGSVLDLITDTNGHYLFMKTGGVWQQQSPSPGGQAATLMYDSTLGQWLFRPSRSSVILVYSGATGRLIEYRWPGSNRRVTISYRDDGAPTTLEDSDTGRIMRVEVHPNDPKRITRLYIDGEPTQSWSYGYDGSGYLRDVWHTPTGARWRHYEPTQTPLGNVLDAENRIIETHNYGSYSRASNSIGPSGDITNIEYNVQGVSSDPTELITRVTDAAGGVRTYYQRSVGGQWKTAQVDGSCSCGTHDAVYGFHESTGNVVRVQNERGYIDEYTYDVLTRSLVTSVYQHKKPIGCDPETSSTRCRLNRFTIMSTELEATSASVRTDYEYNDPNWPERPTRVTRSSNRQPAEEAVESFTYHPTAGTTLAHTVSGWTGLTPRAETRTTSTTLYNGTEGAAFDPGGTFASWWLTLPQPALRQKTVDGPRTDVGDVTQWVYYPIDPGVPAYARGKVAAVRNAAGHITRYDDYDMFGNARLVTDANGVVTQTSYDIMGRLVSSTLNGVSGCDTTVDPLCATDLTTTRTHKNTTGLLEFETRPGGGVTKYEYEARGRLSAISRGSSVTSLSERMEYEIDLATGQKRAEKIFANENGTWVLKKTLSYTYDTFSRVQKVTHPDTSFVQYTYDSAGNVLTAKDENHSIANTTYAYDPAARLSSVKQKLGSGEIETRYFYDEKGNLISVHDPNGNITNYLYDDFGQMIRQTSPVSGVTTYDYNLAGQLTSTTDARGATTVKSYDAIGRVLSSSSRLAGETENVAWNYDASASGPFATGRLTSMTDPSGSTSYGYERRGLLSRETKTVSGTTYETRFRYDADGNRSGVTMPAGDALGYTFDFAARPTALSRSGAAVISSASYMPFGPLKTLTYANNLTRSLTYDSRYRLTSNRLSSVGDLASYSYAYDNTGNITAITDLMDASYSRSFGYDDLNRLTVANSGSSLWGGGSYSYDSMGNLLNLTLGSSRSSLFTYSGTTPKLAQATENGATRSVSYDAAGNEVAVGAGTFAYTPRNSLKSGDSIEYRYDGRGVRVSADRPLTGLLGSTLTVHRNYLYTPELNLLAETAESAVAPAVAHQYLWFGGAPVAQVDVAANTVVYTFTDHLGTPLMQTDATGAVVWRAEHEPYGSVIALRAGSTHHQPLRLPGQEAEQFESQQNGVTERSYNIFRWYRSGWGRYSQVDPLLPLLLNPRGAGEEFGPQSQAYSYGLLSPLQVTDPLGLAPCGPNPSTVPGMPCAERCTRMRDWGRCNLANYTTIFDHMELIGVAGGVLTYAVSRNGLLGLLGGVVTYGLGQITGSRVLPAFAERTESDYRRCVEQCQFMACAR